MVIATPDPTDVYSNQTPCRILVVEDEYIVAYDICFELETLGVEVVGPAGTIEAALAWAATGKPLHGAFLDVNVNGHDVFPVADLLASRKIPFVFATGYDGSMLPARHSAVMQLEKPIDMSDLATALKAMCPTR